MSGIGAEVLQEANDRLSQENEELYTTVMRLLAERDDLRRRVLALENEAAMAEMAHAVEE